MKDKELIEQLNNLKNVKPDSTWKSENRSVLMSQIYGAEDKVDSQGFNLFRSFLKTLPRYAMDLAGQPTMVVLFIFILVFGGSAVSFHFAHNTKPGDSLYIAKIISERTREAFTFNDKDKAQLVIKHARNRAEELSQVLSEETYNGDRVDKLAGEAHKEIEKARTSLKKINTNIAKDTKDENINSDEVAVAVEDEEESQEVFSVNFNKDDAGMQVAETDVAEISDLAKKPVVSSEEKVVKVEPSKEAVPNTLDILDEADEFLTGDNYGATLDKLNEANLAIEKSIVKEEPASSTKEAIMEEGETDTASSTEE